ncbi:MAG TPA: transglutaminase family protein [Desulfobacterales bacterium]|nr:transglutaminase family protein [Desulfobacterales bacterium]
MGNIILLINNIAIKSKAPTEIIELIKWVKDDLNGALKDIASGKIAFHPTKIKEKIETTIDREENSLPANEQKKYLKNTTIINWQHPAIIECAEKININCESSLEYTQKAFEYVRDKIQHSWDFKAQMVTCVASDVLKNKTGYCYAKSHLLAALLRAQKIPTGFCYQRLSLEDNGPPYCLHGLNAVFLKQFGWYRIDSRGNKEGVDAQFTPPIEKLAFGVSEKLEKDLPEIWSDPLPIIVESLQNHKSVEELYKNLPDIQVL